MSWYGSDMCLMCCHLATSLSTKKSAGIGRMQSQTETGQLSRNMKFFGCGIPSPVFGSGMVWRYPGLPLWVGGLDGLKSSRYIHSITWRDMWVCYFKSCWSFSLLLFFMLFLMASISFIYWKSRNVLSHVMSPHQNSSLLFFFRIPFLFFIYQAAKNVSFATRSLHLLILPGVSWTPSWFSAGGTQNWTFLGIPSGSVGKSMNR